MARFRRKPTPVEAVQLRWDTWSEMCELLGTGRFEGCYVDAQGQITEDANARMGLKVACADGKLIAVQDDWVVKLLDGEILSLKPAAFAALFESHADHKVAYEPDWKKYPKLAGVFEHRPPENVYWDDLRALLVDARADAVQYVHDVRAEELTAARADERKAMRAEVSFADSPIWTRLARMFGGSPIMMDGDMLVALKNVGCDMTCDACAETFFTGSAMHPHTCPIANHPDEATWEDRVDKWTFAVKAAHPVRSESHDEYAVAMKMVGNRHSKGALVELVNWLLTLLKETLPMLDRADEPPLGDSSADQKAFFARVQNLRARAVSALSMSESS